MRKERLVEILMVKQVDAAVLVFRQHACEEHIHILIVFQGFEHTRNAHERDFAIHFLERLAQRRQAEGDADHFPVLVFQNRNQIKDREREILFDKPLDFRLGKRDEVEDILVTTIEHLKEILSCAKPDTLSHNLVFM